MSTMIATGSPTDDAEAAERRAAWPEAVRADYESGGAGSGTVGSVLVSETDRVRVWHLTIPAGTRCGFHRHVLNYFWTAHTGGRARNFAEDGRVTETTYRAGDTAHLDFAEGQSMAHSLENTGDTDLVFTTVEFLDGPNAPLPVPDGVRRSARRSLDAGR